jgi:hypothetical protein
MTGQGVRKRIYGRSLHPSEMGRRNHITTPGPLKVKTNLSLCLIKHHAMKTYWGVEVYIQEFLTSVLDGDELSA